MRNFGRKELAGDVLQACNRCIVMNNSAGPPSVVSLGQDLRCDVHSGEMKGNKRKSLYAMSNFRETAKGALHKCIANRSVRTLSLQPWKIT